MFYNVSHLRKRNGELFVTVHSFSLQFSSSLLLESVQRPLKPFDIKHSGWAWCFPTHSGFSWTFLCLKVWLWHFASPSLLPTWGLEQRLKKGSAAESWMWLHLLAASKLEVHLSLEACWQVLAVLVRRSSGHPVSICQAKGAVRCGPKGWLQDNVNRLRQSRYTVGEQDDREMRQASRGISQAEVSC